jgi:iron complex outermembrane receptor protein
MRAVRCKYRVSDLACTLLFISGCTAADTAEAQASGKGLTADPDAIIITARKRVEPLAQTGAPVSVVTGRELLETGTNSTARLNERFPALTVQPTATGNLIFIRGVGNFTLQPNSDPAVGFAYDGVFISRPMGTLSQFFDLDRVELLKGPQGVLYGRNASAGTINIEPRQPVFGETSVSADFSVASYDDVRSEAAINAPLGRYTALRVSAAASGQGSFLRGYSTGPNQKSIRTQVKTRIGERTTVRLSGDYNRIGGVGIGSSYVGNYVFDRSTGRYRFTSSGLSLSQGIYAPEAQAYRQTIFLSSAGRNLDAIGSHPRQEHEFYGIHARIETDLGIGQLTIIPAWRKSNINAIVSGSPFGFDQREIDQQASLEARLAGSRGPFDWLAGTLLFKDSIESDTMTNLSSFLVQSTQSYRTLSEALFGNVTFHASRRARLIGGLRWTQDHKRYDSESGTLAILCLRQVNNRPSCPTVPLFPLVDDLSDVPFPTPVQGGPPLPILADGVPTGAIVARSELDAGGRLTDRAVTWRLGSEVDLGPRSLAYAAIETGYRPGGFNTATGFETYEPERITAYTLGLRHGTADGKIQVDLEAFWWNYRDQQVSSLRPDLSVPARNANITENIGNSRIRGVEADVRVRPWRGAQVRAVVQYLDAHYRSFRYLYANVGVPPLTGCATSLDRSTNLYTVDCTSKQPYNSPRWSMNLSGRQSFALRGFTLTALADTQFRSARNIGFAFLPEQRAGATWTSNAQIVLSTPGDRYEVAAFIRNIENKRIPQFMIYHPVSNALVAGTSPPRQIGLRASLRL